MMQTENVFDVVERNGEIYLSTEKLVTGDLLLHTPTGQIYRFVCFRRVAPNLDVRRDRIVCRPVQPTGLILSKTPSRVSFPIKEMERVVSDQTLWDHLTGTDT